MSEEFLPDAPGVYALRNLITGDEYIGQSVDIAMRAWNHFAALKRGNHPNSRLQDAWDSYGAKAFRFFVLCEMPQNASRDERLRAEASFIKQRHPAYNHMQPYIEPDNLPPGQKTLRQMRQERGVEALQLAIAVGITYYGLLQIEYGKTNPRIQTAEKIYRYLEAPLGSIAWGWNRRKKSSLPAAAS